MSKLRISLVVNVLLTAGYAIIVACIAQIQSRYLESDSLFPYSFLLDASNGLAALRTWFTTPNLYFFPDLFIIGIVMLFSSDPWVCMTVYMGLYLCFFAYLLHWILQPIAGIRHQQQTCAMSIIASLLMIATFQSIDSGDPVTGSLLTILLKPGTHGGAILAGMGATGLILRYGQDGRRLLPIFILCFLGALSDQIFVIQFLAPFLGISLALCLFRPEQRKQSSRLALVILGAWIASQVGLSQVKTLFEYFPVIPPRWEWSESIRASSRFAFDLRLRPLLALLTICSLTLFLGWGIHASIRRVKIPQWELLLLLLFSGGAFSMIAAIITALYISFETTRYMLLLFVAPFPCLVLIFFKIRGELLQAMAGLVLLVMLGLLAPWKTLRQGLYIYPDELKCLDQLAAQHQVQAGYGDYWSSKYVSYLSRQQIKINQIYPEGGKWLWINNRAWYDVAADNGGNHDIILINRLNPKAIRERTQTEPDRIQNCGGYEVWIYSAAKRQSLLKLIQ